MMAKLPPLPLILYAEPHWSPSPARVYLYIKEKQISSKFLLLAPQASNSFFPRDPSPETPTADPDTFPTPPSSTVPQLAIPKSHDLSETQKSQTESYEWLSESSAIVEYLEDLCDAHPEISAVPSLRGGKDLVQRARIRKIVTMNEDVFTTGGMTLLFGSKPYNRLTGQEGLHLPSAHHVANFTRNRILKGIDELLGIECDFEGIEKDVVGAPTIADIAVYASIVFNRKIHGIDQAKGFPNIEKLMDAFAKRKTGKVTMPPQPLPEWCLPFQSWETEEVWAPWKA